MNEPFITYREEDEFKRLCFFILQKAQPHYVGILLTSPREGSLVNMPLPEYNLWITYNGILAGNFVPGYKEVERDIENCFAEMTEWYYLNRIKTDPKKYKHFKINHEDSKPARQDNSNNNQ